MRVYLPWEKFLKKVEMKLIVGGVFSTGAKKLGHR
jgi:hypothetical protein